MADPRRFELDELLIRPGTYFNPQTEVLLVVDDSPALDEIFDLEERDGAEWVLISDESPIDESARDELLERFQIAHHAGSEPAIEGVEDEDGGEDEERLEPDEIDDGVDEEEESDS